MYFDEYVTALAKTDPPVGLLEHSSNVLQVANYLIDNNAANVRSPSLVRAAALTHDVGKIAGDIRADRWIHAPHTSRYLQGLLNDPLFIGLLSASGVDVSSLDHQLLLEICEQHHNPSPKLLRNCKEALLVSVADALASSFEAGAVGPIADILHTNPYTQVSLELLRSLGFERGLDSECHRIGLPGHFTQDLFLADMVFRLIAPALTKVGVAPIMQKGATLWVAGTVDAIRGVLAECKIDPKQLYDSVFDDRIYDTIMDELPPAGSIQVDSVKYILVNENTTRRFSISLCTRKSVRTLFERYNLSHLLDRVDELFASGVELGIEMLWQSVRQVLLELCPHLTLPQTVTKQLTGDAEGRASRSGVALIAPNVQVLNELQTTNKKLAADIKDFLTLFDASRNMYRSLTNVRLEYLKMQAALADGSYSLDLPRVATIDGHAVATSGPVANAALCPVCRRFPHEITAAALITGNPKMDSVYQTYRKTRSQLQVCRWCFLAGYADLPLATITKDGNSVSKSRGYLFLTSPLPREKLQWIIDFVRRGTGQHHGEEEIGEDESVDEESFKADKADPQVVEDIGQWTGGYDGLAVLGLSRQRLSNVKGFVLPTLNALWTMVGLRIPVERLVGEDKISGAVRRELVKATMYDLHRVTGAPTMHYNVVADSPFSVDGQPVTIAEMRASSVAYQITDRYGRVGRYRQLNSGLFLLLLSNPRQAITRVLRASRREHGGRYALGEERIKEVISLGESIARDDWKFELGLRIVRTLVEVGLTPKARGFRFGPGQRDVFTGVELVKWLQRFKMVRDETSARAWATMLINALKRGDLAYREYIRSKGKEITAPGEDTIKKIIALVEGEDGIIRCCKAHRCKLSEFSRDIAEMDYYLLFYHNQQLKRQEGNGDQ